MVKGVEGEGTKRGESSLFGKASKKHNLSAVARGYEGDGKENMSQGR